MSVYWQPTPRGVSTRVHSAPALGLHRRDHMLVLGSDFTGASQCQDVWWKPDLEPHEAAGMLTRLLQGALALAPSMDVGDGDGDRTAVIVALPGVTEAGRSPFWDSFGRHFYDGDREDEGLGDEGEVNSLDATGEQNQSQQRRKRHG